MTITGAFLLLRNITPVTDGQVFELDGKSPDSHFFQDSGMTTPAGVGDPVGAWLDSSVNSYNVVQGTTASKPTRQDGYLEFDGSDDYLENTSVLDLAGDLTVFVVVHFEAGGDETQGVFDYSDGDANTGFSFLYDGTTDWRNGMGAAANLNTGENVDPRDDTTRLYSLVSDADGDMVMRKNAVEIDRDANSENTETETDLIVGGIFSSSYRLDGRIYYLSLYNRVLSLDEITTMETYLNNRFGVY
jgi:hypothetical protein